MTHDPTLLEFAEAAWRLGMLWKKRVKEALVLVWIVKSLGYFKGSDHVCSQVFQYLHGQPYGPIQGMADLGVCLHDMSAFYLCHDLDLSLGTLGLWDKGDDVVILKEDQVPVFVCLY